MRPDIIYVLAMTETLDVLYTIVGSITRHKVLNKYLLNK